MTKLTGDVYCFIGSRFNGEFCVDYWHLVLATVRTNLSTALLLSTLRFCGIKTVMIGSYMNFS